MPIRAVHKWSRGAYGAPRVQAELADEGTSVGQKRIARLMREMGLAGVSRHKGTRTTRRDRDAHSALDLVERDFFHADSQKAAFIDVLLAQSRSKG